MDGLFSCVIMGDLNAAPNTPAIRFLRERGWRICNDAGKGEPTEETEKYGWLEIDYVAVYPKNAAIRYSFSRSEKREASDHFCIWSDVEWEE